MFDPATGTEVNWAIEHIPSLDRHHQMSQNVRPASMSLQTKGKPDMDIVHAPVITSSEYASSKQPFSTLSLPIIPNLADSRS